MLNKETLTLAAPYPASWDGKITKVLWAAEDLDGHTPVLTLHIQLLLQVPVTCTLHLQFLAGVSESWQRQCLGMSPSQLKLHLHSFTKWLLGPLCKDSHPTRKYLALAELHKSPQSSIFALKTSSTWKMPMALTVY